MSTVYRGTDLSLDRVVAVKVAMDPLLERDPVYASRFKREARAAAGISNSGIVTVYDAGADGPTRYIVMEYVDGRDLAAILREERPLDPPRAVRIAEQVADTLAAAHTAGIVHRDIKPGNIMVTPDGQVKVLDFGIARTTDGVNLTQTASVLGTAPYMSPEQAMGQPADARSDIYSLGCVLYEMLTGKPPFMGDLPAAVLHQHVRVAAKPPSAVNPNVPPALDALVVQMLAKSPEDRPQTAAEVRDRLAALETPTDATTPLAPAPPPPMRIVAQPPPPTPAPPAAHPTRDAAKGDARPRPGTVGRLHRDRAAPPGRCGCLRGHQRRLGQVEFELVALHAADDPRVDDPSAELDSGQHQHELLHADHEQHVDLDQHADHQLDHYDHDDSQLDHGRAARRVHRNVHHNAVAAAPAVSLARWRSRSPCEHRKTLS